MSPRRIQLRRTSGWRKPLLAVVVARPSRWGNPFVVGTTTPTDWHAPFAGVQVRNREHAVELLRAFLSWRYPLPADWDSHTGPDFPWESQIRRQLRGRDLACWCPLDEPCHGDLLLDIANPGWSA